ncbi:MAG: tetratricopeptide repeat protein [Flavobacteriaceae bacterium]|nr:tetratricopeptide repeat protein [Flavobacteriaceae bacterium]
MKISLTYLSVYTLYVVLGLTVLVAHISCKTNTNDKVTVHDILVDSTTVCLQNAKNNKLKLKKRIEFLYKAYVDNKSQKNDSIKNSNLLKIAFQLYNFKDTIFYKKINKEAQDLSLQIKDTLALAETYWNDAILYSDNEKMDLTFYNYFQAYKNYESVNNEYYAAKMMYNMGFIQSQIKDYTGSEISTFKAIQKFNKLDRNLNLYRSYKLLGSVFRDLEEYEKALFYHKKALTYIENIKNNQIYIEGSLNDIGLVYQKKGDYKKAIEYFQKVLINKDLKHNNVWHYARIIDNIAYTNFLSGDTIDVLLNFKNALTIKDSLGNIPGRIVSKLHLAEFYAARGDTITAVNNAKESNKLAMQLNNNRDVLKSLLLLSKIDKDGSSRYLEQYVTLSDSLQVEERKLRGKFTRIRFETDVYKEETEKLSEQRIMIVAISVVVVLIIFLLYFIKVQHAKNTALEFEKEQQKAKEEIYELVIKQQSKLEEGRLNERHRISEDLHDGVLGKLFGTRLGLGFLDVKGDSETITKHNALIDELQTIEKEIRTISHELKNDMFSSEISFIDLVEDLIKNQSEIGEFQYAVLFDENINWKNINENIKINCYRIIQEAIQNINKYANAKMVHLEFNLNEEKLKLTIKDNGIGFDKKKIRSGIGLKNMESRIHKIKGEFFINTVINEGTNLIFIIPV